MTSSSTRTTSTLSITLAYYAAFVGLGLVVASLGPTLPGLAENTNTGLSQISYLFTARNFGYMLGSILAGQLYDRVQGHPVMGGALAAIVLFMALVPLVSWFWLLVGLLLLLGTAQGTLDVGGNTLLVWVHREKIGPFMNGLHFVFGIGAFLAPIIIAQAVFMTGGIRWAYWVLALLMSPAVFWLWSLPSPINQQKHEKSEIEPLNKPLLILILLFFFFYLGSEVSFSGWVFTYALESGLADEKMAAYLTSAFFGLFTVGRLLAIPIATRFAPRTILLMDLLGALVGVGILLAFPASTLALWVGAMITGFSVASIFPTMLSFAERQMTITGQITSSFFIGGSIGAMLFPLLIGQLFESWGPQIVMVTIGGTLLVALGLTVLLVIYAPSER